MDFTKEQLSEVLCKHAERENGLQDLMEIMIESMMVAERREYLRADGLPGDKGNGFRMGHTYGQRCAPLSAASGQLGGSSALQDVSFGD